MRRHLSVALLALALPMLAEAKPYSITYNDGAGEGFNDTTVVGSTTLGQIRKDALDYAVAYWAARIGGSQTLTVRAQFDPEGGTPVSAVLAYASPLAIVDDPAGAPRLGAYYPIAVANELEGSDLAPASADITITFNTDVDNNTVLGTVNWYYGLDENAGTNVSMVRTALHELGHGLGFSDSIDKDTGAFQFPLPSIYDKFLRQGSGPGTALTSLSDGGRLSALTSDNLFWEAGTNVATAFGSQPRMYAPNPYEVGSSISHFRESTFTPEELMEPILNSDTIDLGLTDDALKDMGYTIVGPAVLPTTAFTVSPGSLVAENAGVQEIHVGRNGDTSEAVTFNVVFSGTATFGVDYTASATSLTIPVSAVSTMLTVTPVNDGLTEASGETVIVSLSRVLKSGYGATTSVSFTLTDAADVQDWSIY